MEWWCKGVMEWRRNWCAGVLEWREAEGSAGVKEYWSHGAVSLLCCAGPEAGAPRKAREANAGGKRWAGSGLTWEKAGGGKENGPAFPTLARIIRRKWLISRVYAA